MSPTIMGIPVRREHVSSSMSFDEARQQLASRVEPDRFIEWPSGKGLHGKADTDGTFSVVAVPTQPGFRPRLVGKIVPSPTGCEILMAVQLGYADLSAAIVLLGLAVVLMASPGGWWLGAMALAIPSLLSVRAAYLVRKTRARVLEAMGLGTTRKEPSDGGASQ
jgi:hypothetical protein